MQPALDQLRKLGRYEHVVEYHGLRFIGLSESSSRSRYDASEGRLLGGAVDGSVRAVVNEFIEGKE